MKTKSEDEDKEKIQIYYTRCNNKIRVDYNFNKFKTSEFITIFGEKSIYSNNNGKIRTLKEIFDKNLPKLFKLLAVGDLCKSYTNLLKDVNILFNAITVNILNAYFKEKEKNE